MRNYFITYLYDFTKNFSKDGIDKIPNENVSDLTKKINYLCQQLS